MSIINATNVVEEFRLDDMKAIINNVPLGDLKYRDYFPLKFNTNLSFANLEAESGAKVMADIVALDSNVPLKGRDFVSKVTGEIPKIEVGRMKTERDMFRIQELRQAVQLHPTDAGVKNQLIDAIYDDSIFVVNAINARLEQMSKSLLSQGFFKTGNGVKIDFSIKTERSSDDWFAKAKAKTFDPIEDLRTAQTNALAKGFRYTQAVMDLATFNQLVKSDSVVKFTASFAQNALGLAQEPTLSQLNTALQAHGLPAVVIWESYVNEEGKNGALTATSAWELGNIHLCTSAEFGELHYTISPEVNTNLGEISKATAGEFMLVSVFGEPAPIRLVTKGLAFATPVLNNTKHRLILKTKHS